jgi:hypothetical protein
MADDSGAKQPGQDTPTEDEIAQLPRWARVAFAVRCAQRVRPIVTRFNPQASLEQIALMDRVIELTRFSAAEATQKHTLDLDDLTKRLVGVQLRSVKFAASAAMAGESVAGWASGAASAAWFTTIRELGRRMFGPAISAAMRRDLALLLDLAKAEGWTDATGVDVDRLGPLWPDGPPEGWPADGSEDEPRPVMKVQVTVPPGLTDAQRAQFEAKLADLFAAMSAYDAEMGGSGLRILDSGGFTESPVGDTADDSTPEPTTELAAGGGR